MKKRFLFPAILIGAPIVIGVADAAIHGIGCATGHQGACAELAERKEYGSPEEVAKRDAAREARFAKRQAEQVQAEAVRKAQPAYRINAAGGQQAMIRSCESILKPSLKDPNSYRYLKGQVVVTSQTEMEVRLTYTATNSFGGRTQNAYTCTQKA